MVGFEAVHDKSSFFWLLVDQGLVKFSSRAYFVLRDVYSTRKNHKKGLDKPFFWTKIKFIGTE
jgi:hypothetical protein